MIRSKTKRLIERNEQDLENINQQRRWWLVASSLVFLAIIGLILGWNFIEGLNSKPVWWALVSAMLIISVNWWYWTMRVMLRLIKHQQMEFAIIHELLFDIKGLKTDIKKLADQTLDKSK